MIHPWLYLAVNPLANNCVYVRTKPTSAPESLTFQEDMVEEKNLYICFRPSSSVCSTLTSSIAFVGSQGYFCMLLQLCVWRGPGQCWPACLKKVSYFILLSTNAV